MVINLKIMRQIPIWEDIKVTMEKIMGNLHLISRLENALEIMGYEIRDTKCR